MYNFELCKICKKSAKPKYRIKAGTIWVCSSCGFHYLDYLDELDCSVEQEGCRSGQDEIRNIESALHYNKNRFISQIQLVSNYIELENSACLDIGCGGGLFLSLLKENGAACSGIAALLHSGDAHRR